ncbi:MAG: glycosyltransferase family 4 protein [Candidatus Riflebacteria bacterium]|nr:glycosyltransferase family 4 protein [Candidatus Riflebacteria bacterium]
MNILIVGNLYPPFIFGGYEILCQQVVEEFKARGHNVHVLTSDYGLDFAPASVQNEIGITRSLRLTTSFPRPGENVGFVDFRLSSIQRIAAENFEQTTKCISEMTFKPDIVFCWCLNRLSLGPVFAAKKLSIPAAYTINDEHPKQFRFAEKPSGIREILRFLAEKMLYPMATLRYAGKFPVTIISRALKNSLLRQQVPIEHAEIIYQGIPVSNMAFETAALNSGSKFKVLYAGQISRVKGVHTIIKALGSIRKRSPEFDIGLTILGSGVPDYRAELEKLVQDYNLHNSVEFKGKVAHSEIAYFHHSHHCFVFSSEWEEPFGLTHLEAMAYGNPVISTTTGGSAELIKNEINALAYTAGNAEELSDKLLILFNNNDYRMKLARSARKYAEDYHSLSVYVSNLEKFLHRRL